MKNKIFVFPLTILLSAPMAIASVAPTLSWQDCVSKATGQNSEIQSAVSALQSSHDTEKSAWGNFYPQLTGTLGYNYGTGSSFQTVTQGAAGTSSSFGTATTPGSPSENSTYSANLLATENLFNGFQDKAKINQARANVDLAQVNVATVKAKINYDLKSSFEGLVYAQDAVTLADKIIQRRLHNLQLVELRFEDGRENKGSLLLSKAYLKDAEYAKLQANDNITIAQAQLARVIGEEDFGGLKISGAVPISEPPARPDFERLAMQTTQHEQAVGQEAQTQAGVTLAEGAFYPSLNLTGATGWVDQNFFPQNNHWSVGVNLTIPLFSGLKDYYGSKAARATYTASSFTRANVDRQELAALKQAYTAFVEAVERDKVDQSYLEAATVRADIARAKYNTGLLTYDEWDIIENDLIARQRAALQSRRDRVVAEAAWEQAQGVGVIQ
jgi:outer membrane protein